MKLKDWLKDEACVPMFQAARPPARMPLSPMFQTMPLAPPLPHAIATISVNID